MLGTARTYEKRTGRFRRRGLGVQFRGLAQDHGPVTPLVGRRRVIRVFSQATQNRLYDSIRRRSRFSSN